MKLKIFLFCILMFSVGYSQQNPLMYKLGDENKTGLAKSENPASNSINDILIFGDTIWLATSRGLSRSFDNGATWTNYYNTDPFGTESITAIGYFKGILFASTAHSVERDGQTLPEGSGLKFSIDKGETWSSAPQSLDDPNDTIVIYGINNIRALPVTVAIQNITYDVAFHRDYIYTASFAGGIRKIHIDTLLANPLAKWNRVVIPPDRLSSIKPTDSLNFALQPVAGKFGPESNLNHRGFSVLGASDTLLLVGTANGINKSTDGGVSWVKFNHQNAEDPISGNFVVALDYSSEYNVIWAATWKAEDLDEFYGISFSEDGGYSWKTALGGEKVHNFGVMGDLVIAVSSSGPFLSTRKGLNWILPGNIVDTETRIVLKTNHFYSAAFSPNRNETWLGSTDGLVKHFSKSSIWGDKWKIYYASQTLESGTQTYAFPNPFSPKTEQVKIKYSTNGKNAKVTIRIFDFGINLVRTVIQNADRGEPFHRVNITSDGINGVIDHWDGRDEAGNIVPNGVYFYRIDIDSDAPIFGKIMVLQ